MPRANNNSEIRARAKAALSEQSSQRRQHSTQQKPRQQQRQQPRQQEVKIPEGTFRKTEDAFDFLNSTMFGAYVRKYVMNNITDRDGNLQRPQLRYAPLLFLFQLLFFRLILDAKTSSRIEDFKKKEGKIAHDDFKRIFFHSPTIQSIMKTLFGNITFSQEEGKDDQQIINELMKQFDDSSILGIFKSKYSALLAMFDEKKAFPKGVDFSLYHNIFPSIDTHKPRDQVALSQQLSFEKLESQGKNDMYQKLYIPPASTLINVLEKKLEYLGYNMEILDESYDIKNEFTPTWGQRNKISTPFTFLIGELVHSSLVLFDTKVRDEDIERFIQGQKTARARSEEELYKRQQRQMKQAKEQFNSLK